jgi:Transposase DDE domain/High-affinity nickel-transport protein
MYCAAIWLTVASASEALYHHRRSLFGALSVAFFDTTSLYFEGRGGATLGRRGYSKDFRPQLHQVVLGIVLDENDRPIASFLWPGNTADVTTLLPVVERLRSRFGVSRACVVADRGMISAATIAGLEAQGIDYILGVRERTLREIRQTVLEDDGVAVPLVISRQKGETDLAVKNVEVAGRRYVVCRNEARMPRPAQPNLVITAVSVVAAVLIGGIEGLGLLGDRLGLTGWFWDSVGTLNSTFNGLGFAIIGVFIFACVVLAPHLLLCAYCYARVDDLGASSTRG